MDISSPSPECVARTVFFFSSVHLSTVVILTAKHICLDLSKSCRAYYYSPEAGRGIISVPIFPVIQGLQRLAILHNLFPESICSFASFWMCVMSLVLLHWFVWGYGRDGNGFRADIVLDSQRGFLTKGFVLPDINVYHDNEGADELHLSLDVFDQSHTTYIQQVCAFFGQIVP